MRRPLFEQLAGYRPGRANMAVEQDREQGRSPAPIGLHARAGSHPDSLEGGSGQGIECDTSLDGLVGSIPRELSAEIERDYARQQPFHLLELEEDRQVGHPSTVDVRVLPGQTELRAFDGEGICRTWVVADTGWSACCHYPISVGGGLVYLTRTEEVRAAMQGAMLIHGDLVDTAEIVTFLGRHFRTVITRLLAGSVGSALTYRCVFVRGPAFLELPLRAVGSVAPHIKLEAE